MGLPTVRYKVSLAFSGIEEIKLKRLELNQEIEKEEHTKKVLEGEISQLQVKLDTVNTSLKKKINLKENYDRAIQESESAYMQVICLGKPNYKI